MGVPISGKHAIEVAVFVALFQTPFSPRALEALSGLQEHLKSEFPSFQTLNVIELKMEDGGAATPSIGAISGVLLQKLSDDGRQEWVLRAEGNVISVQCFKYQNWEETSACALKYLHTAVANVLDGENSLVLMALQIVDRFVSPTSEDYDIGHVFNKRSRYLTKQAMEAGALWHVHQGWFEDFIVTEGKLLNVLNLSTNNTPSGFVTTVDHNAQFQSEGVAMQEASDIVWIKSVFGELHDKNKMIVRELLNAKQKKAIKL